MNEIDEELAKGSAPAKEVESVTSGDYDGSMGKKRNVNRLIASIVVLIVIVAILIGTLVGKRNRDSSTNDLKNPDLGPGINNDDSEKKPSNESVGEADVKYFEFDDAPVPFSIPLYSPENIGVYLNESEALSAFENFGRFLVSNIALRNLGFRGFGFAGGLTRDTDVEEAMFEAPIAADSSVADESFTSSNGQSGETADAFETNNQEQSVDQADVAKSDGNFIFAAFSDYLLIFRARSEELVLRLAMPEINEKNDCFYPDVMPIDTVIVDEEFDEEFEEDIIVADELEEVETVEAIGTEDIDVATTETFFEDTFIVAPDYCYRPKPTIQAILVSTGRLALIVSGYGHTHRQSMPRPPVLWDYLSTQLRVYDTTDLESGNLPLIGVKNINGYYNEAFVIDNVAHVVTTSGINTYNWLVAPAERFNASDADFVQELRADAEETFIPRFANALLEELSNSTGSAPTISRFNMMVDGLSGVPGFENSLLRDGVVNSMAQITSFDMESVGSRSRSRSTTDDEADLEVSITCQFMGSYWSQAYATDDMLILAGQGSRFVQSLAASEEATFLFGFRLEGAATVPDISGVVPGSLLSPYSIDYLDGFLRVATTISNRVFVSTFLAEPVQVARPVEDSQSGSDGSEVLVATTTTTTVTSGNGDDEEPETFVTEGGGMGEEFSNSIEIVTDCSEIDEECMLDETLNACQEIFLDGCEEVFYSKSSSCTYTFDCLDRYDTIQCPRPTDACMTFDNFLECNELVKDGCSNIVTLESFPCQFQCEDEIVIEPPILLPVESTTENQIYVLTRQSGAQELKIVGNATLGKPNEWFTAVRFFDNVAYAVTFQQTDPFYVIDFPSPGTPRVLGELNVTGFSRYLHPIDSANNLILGIGQEADEETGRITGLQISLFDATDRLNPTLIHRHHVQEQWASSVAERDEKAFRYLKLSDDHGRLVIPVSYRSSDDGSYFDGFSVFVVTLFGIYHDFDISHNEDSDLCYYCGYLPERSFVIDGDVITLKGRSARSHDLDTATLKWGLDFAWQSDQCCNG